jgi:hypothetical protein
VNDSDPTRDPKLSGPPRGARRPRAYALATLVVAAGCGGEAELPPVPEPQPGVRVVLGTGREAFEPLNDEASVPLIRGIQGGWHVWTSFLAYGFDTDVLRMDLTTRWEGVEESVLGGPGNVAVRPALDATGAPALASVGWPAVVYNPTCADGHRLLVNLTVLDTEGRSASDTHQWIMEVPEAERSSDCDG